MNMELSSKLIKILPIRLLTEKEILVFVNDLIDYIGINDYLSYISFDEKIGVNNLAMYNFDQLSLKINLKNIKKYVNKAYSLVEDIQNVNNILFTNLAIIISIIHEEIHAYQNYLIHEEDLSLGLEFYKELEFAYNNYQLYIDNYQCFTFERDACSSSYETILKYLKMYYPKEVDLFNYYLSYLDILIRHGYIIGDKITSPVETLYHDLFKEKPISIDGIDLIDRMKLGFQITKEDYNNYYENTRKLLLSKMNLHD